MSHVQLKSELSGHGDAATVAFGNKLAAEVSEQSQELKLGGRSASISGLCESTTDATIFTVVAESLRVRHASRGVSGLDQSLIPCLCQRFKLHFWCVAPPKRCS